MRGGIRLVWSGMRRCGKFIYWRFERDSLGMQWGICHGRSRVFSHIYNPYSTNLSLLNLI